MGWPVQPDGLYDLLAEFKRDYGNPAVFIAENGAAYDDQVEADGQIHDPERVRSSKTIWPPSARALRTAATSKAICAGACSTISNGPSACPSDSASFASITTA